MVIELLCTGYKGEKGTVAFKVSIDPRPFPLSSFGELGATYYEETSPALVEIDDWLKAWQTLEPDNETQFSATANGAANIMRDNHVVDRAMAASEEDEGLLPETEGRWKAMIDSARIFEARRKGR